MDYEKIKEQAIEDFKKRTRKYEDWLWSLRLKPNKGSTKATIKKEEFV